MSGTLRGTVDARIVAVNDHYASGEVFKVYFDAMEAHPNVTRVALFYGTGSGTGYHDEAGPFGNGAFAVWRWEPTGARLWPFYTMLFVNSVTAPWSGGGWLREGDGLTTSTSNVIMSNAVGVGGDENPWNGSTNNNGLDTVGSPRWATPAGGTGIIVAPATNRDGSEDAALKNNCVILFETTATYGSQPHRVSIIMDDDGFVSYTDERDDLGDPVVYYVGLYEPAAHLAVPRPFVCIGWDGAMVPDTVISDERAAISGVNGNTRVVSYTWDKTQGGVPYNPDKYAEAYVPQRIALFATWDATDRGFLGWLPDMITTLTGGSPGSANAGKTKVILGRLGNTPKYLIAWDGATIPFSTMTRQGVSFP